MALRDVFSLTLSSGLEVKGTPPLLLLESGIGKDSVPHSFLKLER